MEETKQVEETKRKRFRKIWTILGLVFFLCAILLFSLSESLDNRSLEIAGIALFAVALAVYAVDSIIKSVKSKKRWAVAVSAVCIIAMLSCFTVCAIFIRESETIWEEIDALKEERSQFEYGTEEHLQIEQKIDAKRDEYSDKSSQYL